MQALFQLKELLSIILDENYDAVDTSIPINCQVLASTFYFEVDEPPQPSRKHYLFELIQDKAIWQNVQFWERTISQYIQNDIIDQIDHESF
jgi:hypothetical protein